MGGDTYKMMMMKKKETLGCIEGKSTRQGEIEEQKEIQVMRRRRNG